MKSIIEKIRWTSFILCFIAVSIIAGSWWHLADCIIPVAYGQAPIIDSNLGDTGNKTFKLLKVLFFTIMIVTGAGGFGAYLAIRRSKK